MSTTIYLLDQPPVTIEEKSWETVVEFDVDERPHMAVIKKNIDKYIVLSRNYSYTGKEIFEGFLLWRPSGSDIFSCIDDLANHLALDWPEHWVEEAAKELKKNYPPVKI